MNNPNSGCREAADCGAGEMEEAYSELYQKFLQLQSLCMRQAALLHQLTTALQKHQGASIPNGDLADMVSIPVQCTQELPSCPKRNPPSIAGAPDPAAQCGVNAGTFSDLLVQDMSKLCVDGPRQGKEEGILEQKIAPLVSLDSSRWRGATSSATRSQQHVDHGGLDRTMLTLTAPRRDSPPHLCDHLHQTDGQPMSDVAMLSHVCEFCQAVFPSDTTTRGEFLRHLYTHVT